MKILQPVYYDDFECIADKCKDSCCIGWKVIIDKKSFSKYRKIKGAFGYDLNKNIKRNRNNKNEYDYGEMILNNDMRCACLNSSNLCDIYINKGADYLCDTCAEYPRVIQKYGNILEKNLTLSCPRVAEMLVVTDDQFSFEMKDEAVDILDKRRIHKSDYNKELYNLLWEGRSFSIEIAQFREIPIWKRLIFIKFAEGRLQKLLNSGEFIKANEVIENLRTEITNKDVIDSLDNIEKVSNIVKINLIALIIEERISKGIGNHTFIKVIDNLNDMIENKKNKDLELLLVENQSEFDEYFKNKEYILENYIVYNLYAMYMKALETKDLNKEIYRLMISYSVIKIFLIAAWVKNNKKLIDEEIIDVLYSFSRNLEHMEPFIESLYNEMKLKGYDSVGYLVTMIY